jgi:hypothetical protein
MYTVHVSQSFLLSPTLASSLYLLLLRFAARQFADVAQLSSAIATDASHTAEEAQVCGKRFPLLNTCISVTGPVSFYLSPLGSCRI